MSLENAQRFVSRMKEDKQFRNKIQGIADNKQLKEYLGNQGYNFDECELIGAMAACMAELEKGK
ncbi:MAG TPA: Nif11-like leader peptide family natural product precursor [Thermodesulfobacteriota bacterium]|nr:Nif11-like leader peptide family natural product precursor [Thermodesulfobacteriota bacterium]